MISATRIILRSKGWLIVVLCAVLTSPLSLSGQQRGQYVPGQYGLNSGILPDPGFTYANLDINFNTSTLNDSSGNALPPKPKLNLWVVQNAYFYVSDSKFLGANIGFMAAFPILANGSVTLEQVNQKSTVYGLADMWVQPFTLGWHLKRADIQVGFAAMLPTGRYSPGASDNIGSGYVGSHFFMGDTVYLTKNKGTSASIFTDWEVHSNKQGQAGTSQTPGQAVTIEWGLGQVLPLKKDMSRLLQVGAIGYDQWQITDNSGNLYITTLPNGTVITVPASSRPYYSFHAAGGQANFILPKKGLSLFFKYEHEYSAKATTLGDTMVFGGTWTLRFPKNGTTP